MNECNSGEAEVVPPIPRVWERCWCWQYGRCLVDCPTADYPKPVPLTDENWINGLAAIGIKVRDRG